MVGGRYTHPMSGLPPQKGLVMRNVCKNALKAACYILLGLLVEAIMMTAAIQQPETAPGQSLEAARTLAASRDAPAFGNETMEQGNHSFCKYMVLMHTGGKAVRRAGKDG